MNRFRKLGFIEYNGEIRVHNTCSIYFFKNDSAVVAEPASSFEQFCSEEFDLEY